MKTLKKIGRFIAAAALIASGLCACATAAPPVELDAAKLASMQNASWTAEALVTYPSLLFQNNQFEELDENEIAYFRNITAINELDYWTYYALTAPEFPGTYYYLRKTEESSMLSNWLSGGVEPWDFWKSTTIDNETFARNNTLLKAEWIVKVLESQPSFEGFEHIVIGDEQVYFVREIVQIDMRENGTSFDGVWCEITSPDFPGLTYYYYLTNGVYLLNSGLYKRQQ